MAADAPNAMIDYLTGAFLDDFWLGNMDIAQAGWRYITTLPGGNPIETREIARQLFAQDWLDTHPDDAIPAKRIRIKLSLITLDMKEFCHEQAESTEWN